MGTRESLNTTVVKTNILFFLGQCRGQVPKRNKQMVTYAASGIDLISTSIAVVSREEIGMLQS